MSFIVSYVGLNINYCIYIHAIINRGYECMFRQLTRFTSYVSFKDETFLRITLVSSTAMFLWIFILLKPKLAVQLFTLKKMKKKLDLWWHVNDPFYFHFSDFWQKFVSWKIAKRTEENGVLDACILCLLLLFPEEFSIRRHSSYRVNFSFFSNWFITKSSC